MENKRFEDLYEVLDVDLGSSKKEILSNYKKFISSYNNIVKNGNSLSDEQKWEVKLLKIAKYVLTNDTLRKKYNVSRILLDSDDNNIEQNLEPDSNSMEYKEFKQIDVPLRKDQPINLKELADRQFERFSHKSFDLTKDRMLRGSSTVD
jgi:DnaJ-class molecular chaperone|tara:strand:- start:685 stop:1131 length:447 start_codon:yes stop_codon:yes gene_type:complete